MSFILDESLRLNVIGNSYKQNTMDTKSVNYQCIDPLIRNAQRSKDAFPDLVERYQQHVVRNIRAFTKNRHDIEDLAQETWIKVYQAIGKLKPPYHLEGWIARIARNTAKDWLKSQQCRISRLTHELKSWNLQESAVLATLHRGLTEKVRYAVDALSPRYRQVVYEFYMCGYSASEIGQRLNIPVSTVYSRLKEAKKQLGKQFDGSVARV